MLRRGLYILLILALRCTCAVLLVSFNGEVGGGNYSYYNLMHGGDVSVYLYSTSGDADLYVSQYISKPTFEPESHCLQSVTCGVDVVRIPESFQRPVYIAVYGHPSHEVNQYTLDVVYEPTSRDLFYEEVDADSIVKEEDSSRKGFPEDNNFQGRQVEEGKEETLLGSILWAFITILEVLFL